MSSFKENMSGGKAWNWVSPGIKCLFSAARRLRSEILTIGLRSDLAYALTREESDASAVMSVIVSINDAPSMLVRCLSSLVAFGPEAEVVLVDDGSQLPETHEVIGGFAQRPNWSVVRHEVPRGHSRSCEAGARLATRPILCLLNSDTYVTPWSWLGAKEAFDSDPQIAVTGPTTSYSATAQMIKRAEYCRHYWTAEQICAFAQSQVIKSRRGDWRDIPVAGGFALFIRKQTWDALGGFDLKLPDYGNESELCRRVRIAGYRIVWTPQSYIHHFGHQSYGRLGKREIDRRARDSALYINRLYGR